MTLRVLYDDKPGIQEIHSVTRLFLINRADKLPAYLYYETVNDERGKGRHIPYEHIKNWEVNAVIPGANIPL